MELMGHGDLFLYLYFLGPRKVRLGFQGRSCAELAEAANFLRDKAMEGGRE
jgi:hypothetical protein